MADSASDAKTMKAVRFHGQRDIRVEQIPSPSNPPPANFIALRPSFTGICGSDLHEYLGGPGIIPTAPHPITKESVPITLGHEFSGVITDLGEGVTDIAVGDRVTVQPIIYDGVCAACKSGYINCCEKNGFVGLSGWGGGLSERVVVPRTAVYKVPENVEMDVAALVEPLAVGWHSVKISPFKAGDSVLVLGGGPIGLAVIQALVARKSASHIIVSEVSKARKEFAKQFGATDVVDPTQEDLVKGVGRIVGAEDAVGKYGIGGVDVVFDCAGVQSALYQAVMCLKARGTIVNVAVWEGEVKLVPSQFLFRERKYMGIATYQEGDYTEVLEAIASGNMKPGPMITKKIRIDDVVEQGFEALIKDKDNQVKIMIDMT